MKKRKYYLWVDTETAGLLYDEAGTPLPADLMELSAILTDENFNPIFERNWVIKYTADWLTSMPTDVQELLSKNGLLAECKQSSILVHSVDRELANLVNQYTSGNSLVLLAGNNVAYDKEVIRRNLPAVYSKLYYRILDVSSIKELLLQVDPQVVYKAQNKKEYRHRALQDIQESIEELKDYWITFADVINSY